MSALANETCATTFEEYVGISPNQSQYYPTYLTPTEGSWARGDRNITCVLFSRDNSQISGSLKGAAK